MHAAIAVLAGFSVACFGRPTYECSDEAQCVVGGVMGVCEPDGLCSYADDGCPSGQRYGPYAGDKAEACVPEGAASTDDPSTGAVTTSTSTPTSSEPSTSTSDDPSTGCVTECPDGAQELWSTVASDLGSGRAHGIAVSGSSVAIAGEVTIEDRIAFVVVRFDADGELTTTFEWPTSVGGPDRGLAIAALSGGALVVAGAETTMTGDERGVLFRLEDATVAWSRPFDTTDADVLEGVAVDASDRIVAVGRSGGLALAIARDAEGGEVYSRTFAAPGDGSASSLHAVAATAGGGALIGGAVELSATASELWMRRLGADGGVVLDRQPDNRTGTADIAHAVANPADGGSLVGGVRGGNAWLARYDPAGSDVFAGSVLDGGSVRAIAIAGDGTIIAVGHEDAAGERDAWLAAYDLDGGEQWRIPAGAPGDDEALALALADGIAYVAGYRMDAIWVAAYAL